MKTSYSQEQCVVVCQGTLLLGACLFEMSLCEMYYNNWQPVKLGEYRDICNAVAVLQKEGKCAH